MDRVLRLLILSFVLAGSPAALADADGYAAGVSSVILERGTTTADGAPIAYPCTDRPEVTAAEVTIAPGAETGWHKHPIPLYAYVQQGELEVRLDDGRVSSFHGGDVIFEVVDTWHNGKNVGDDEVKLIVFYLGIAGEPTTIKRNQ
ncbi:cupin domain-containing protein [Thioflavicoccus mobilis 8321]|uniref:Cupin domain-containing protein n=1 Tax=Thioflavicoccus mobilis 8321 TaxID=765912 RepID=L0H3A7_9GAMM|nr:cupin domain-containing protein [Thioflavicoccus mobilis]AGA92069.1 cupin domain-containing protein [Thioflavicoccus mobilis 8321]